jgi:hypothetical protein
MQYGPGEDSWLAFPEAGRVHSLYVIAAKHLAEDRAQLWEQMGELVEQGRVDRFVGLSLQDQVLAEYVRRDQDADTTLVVQRGASGMRYGREEEIILTDGTRLQSRPEIIEGQDALIRAISFLVQ